MFVVWKRPDGFHGAVPQDFHVVEVGGSSRLWLHKRDQRWFPFRISGGWQESATTQRLNLLVNLLGQPPKAWIDQLVQDFHNSMSDEAEGFLTETKNWITSLCGHLKGDTWEMEIMTQAFQDIAERLDAISNSFSHAAARGESAAPRKSSSKKPAPKKKTLGKKIPPKKKAAKKTNSRKSKKR